MSAPFQPPRRFVRPLAMRGTIAAHVNPLVHPVVVAPSLPPPVFPVHHVVFAQPQPQPPPPPPPPTPTPMVHRVAIMVTNGASVVLQVRTYQQSLPGHTLRVGQRPGDCLRALMGQLGLPHAMLKHFDITHRGMVTRVYVYPLAMSPMALQRIHAAMAAHRMQGPPTCVHFHARNHADGMTADAMAYAAANARWLM